MNRLRFASRFVIIGAASGTLIVGLLIQFMWGVSQQLGATRDEIAGARAVAPIRQITDAIHDYAITLTLISVGSSENALEDKAKADVQRIEQRLASGRSAMPAAWEEHATWNTLAKEWQKANADFGAAPTP
ncbi:MAG TPA: hypothetical protein VJ572_01885, partial [Azonexus sp.]|nr:hypothetical protein [Azonexus sp.]